MYSKVITVTPAEALIWLETKNSRNRPVKQNIVDRYAHEMKNRNWKMNGQAIIFGKSGQLLNGQHRLKAVVQSGVSIETVVVYGIEDAAFDTIDNGASRSLADVFAVNGEPCAHLLSAGVRFLWLYVTGQVGTRDMRRQIATNKAFEETLEKHPGLRSSVKMYGMLKAREGGILVPASLGIGLHYLFTLIDEQKADEFFSTLQSGLGLTEGHPVALLRQRLIVANKDSSKRVKHDAVYFYVVTAWNAFAAGKTIKSQHMAYSSESPSPEINDLPPGLMADLL